MNSERSPGTQAESERDVRRALFALPAGYRVDQRPEPVAIKRGDRTYSYEPDMVVHDPEGRTLFIEVKTACSLSWSNLARLVEINREARQAGSALLVIVPGGQAGQGGGLIKEFDEVRFSYSDDEPGIVSAVLDAFAGIPTPAVS